MDSLLALANKSDGTVSSALFTPAPSPAKKNNRNTVMGIPSLLTGLFMPGSRASTMVSASAVQAAVAGSVTRETTNLSQKLEEEEEEEAGPQPLGKMPEEDFEENEGDPSDAEEEQENEPTLKYKKLVHMLVVFE